MANPDIAPGIDGRAVESKVAPITLEDDHITDDALIAYLQYGNFLIEQRIKDMEGRAIAKPDQTKVQ